MEIEIITLFPNIFSSFISPDAGLTGRAIESGKAKISFRNLRDYGYGVHQSVDDTPYGGGAGMVLRPELTVKAINDARAASSLKSTVIMLTPQGELLKQKRVRELSSHERLVLLCGRYEGFDERVRHFVDMEISIGDYVLTGGEYGAMVLMDAVIRQLPGVLGNSESLEEESHSHARLEYPQYTRPERLGKYGVPEVLLSGHHEKIAAWRRRRALLKTMERRPDLITEEPLSAEELKLLTKGDPV